MAKVEFTISFLNTNRGEEEEDIGYLILPSSCAL
jgi:hypothetical protein